MSVLSTADAEPSQNNLTINPELALALALAAPSGEKDAEEYAYELAYDELVEARAMTLDPEVREAINDAIDVVHENAGWI